MNLGDRRHLKKFRGADTVPVDEAVHDLLSKSQRHFALALLQAPLIENHPLEQRLPHPLLQVQSYLRHLLAIQTIDLGTEGLTQALGRDLYRRREYFLLRRPWFHLRRTRDQRLRLAALHW